MEKELFISSALYESVESVLENVKPEHVLLNAIMGFQTTTVKELVPSIVEDLNMLRERIHQMVAALEAYKINGGKVEGNAVCEEVERLDDGLAAGAVLTNAIGLLANSTAVEQLRSSKGRSTVTDLANVCGAFVRLRDAVEHYAHGVE